MSPTMFKVWIDNPNPLPAPKVADFMEVFRREMHKLEFGTDDNDDLKELLRKGKNT